MRVEDLATPALLVDAAILERNIATMANAHPATRLRPHVKAHKCTALARHQRASGHEGFTCATIREVEGMVAAGLGHDLLLANEVADATRLGHLLESDEDIRITLAVDSKATIDVAVEAGVQEVLIDLDVGLPRCGCSPNDAVRLAEIATDSGLCVRGVMGYEGHAVGVEDRARRTEMVEASSDILRKAHKEVGGEVCSGGGTGSFDLNSAITELQAGSYVLMDAAYGKLGLPFAQALTVLSTVISVNKKGWVVADCGLKAFGMDHGNPDIATDMPPGSPDVIVGVFEEAPQVLYCSDEHLVFSDMHSHFKVGDKVAVIPAHIDPTVAYHERIHVTEGTSVVEIWPVDLRGW